MARQSKPPLYHPFPFNERAHGIVGNMIEAAEEWLVRNGVCQAHETDEYLTIEYIKQCGKIIEHASSYIESDGYSGTDIFLWYLSNASKSQLRAKYNRNWQVCSSQLHWHTKFYFRNYLEKLRESYLELLPALPDVKAIDRNGILKLAAANLADVRRDINRERRRRGAESDRLIVPDEIMNLRISHTSRNIIVGMKNTRKLPFLMNK